MSTEKMPIEKKTINKLEKLSELNNLNKIEKNTDLSIYLNKFVMKNKLKFKIFVPKQQNKIKQYINSNWNLKKIIEQEIIEKEIKTTDSNDVIYELLTKIDELVYELLNFYSKYKIDMIISFLEKLDNIKNDFIYPIDITNYICKIKLFIERYFENKIVFFVDIYK